MSINNILSQPGAVHLSHLESLRSFDCSKSELNDWPTLPASLEIIDCTDCFVRETPTIADKALFGKLRVALLARSLAATFVLASIQMSESSSLARLDVDLQARAHHQDLDWPIFTALLHKGLLRDLTFLSLWSTLLRDEHAQQFVEGCPRLERLELAYAKITGVFVVGLVTAPGCQLKHLVLKDCNDVSLDTIAWARHRGVLVERRSTEASVGSGRRVHGLH